MKGVGMNQEERMDAMTPSQSAPEREPETPTALRFMGETMARQVELGIVIEQAHQSEVRAHRNTKMRLDRANGDRARLERYNLDLLAKQEQVRDAIAGDVFDKAAPPDGDVLAEARELYARAYNLERELLEAKALLESAHSQSGNWESERRNWYERVRMVLTGGEPQTPDNPWGANQPGPDDDAAEAYRREHTTEEAKGESHS